MDRENIITKLATAQSLVKDLVNKCTDKAVTYDLRRLDQHLSAIINDIQHQEPEQPRKGELW